MKSFSKVVVFMVALALPLACSSEQKTEDQLYAEAQQYSEKGELDHAIRVYRKILKLYPESENSYRALFLTGLIYSQHLKDDKKAETIYRKFLAKYPNGEELLYNEAQSFSEKEDFTSAIQTYQEILKLYPESVNSCRAQFLIGFVYSENLKDYEKAREVYEKVIETYPECDLADDARFMLESMGRDSLPETLTE